MSLIEENIRRLRTAHPAIQLAVLFVFAFVFRWAVVGSMAPNPMNPDYAEYERLAKSMVEQGQYGFGADWRADNRLAKDERRFLYEGQLATSRPPGFPLVLASAMALGFDAPRAFQVIAVLAESINLLIIAALAARFFGPAAGGIAGLLWLFMPRSYAYIVYLIREPYITLFFLLGIALLLRVPDKRSLRLAAASGLCFGVGTYFKETVILTILPAFVWLALLAWKDKRRSLVVCAGVLAITAVAAIAPWVVRNSMVLGEVSGFSNFGWFNVKRALVSRAWLDAQPADLRKTWEPRESMPAPVVDQLLKAQVMAYVKAQPIQTVTNIAANIAGFWSPISRDAIEGNKRGVKDLVSGIYSLGCFALAFLCFWRLRERPETHLFVLTLAFATLAHGMFPGYPRFRYPYDALMIVFAGGQLHYLWLKLREGKIIGPAAQ